MLRDLPAIPPPPKCPPSHFASGELLQSVHNSLCGVRVCVVCADSNALGAPPQHWANERKTAAERRFRGCAAGLKTKRGRAKTMPQCRWTLRKQCRRRQQERERVFCVSFSLLFISNEQKTMRRRGLGACSYTRKRVATTPHRIAPCSMQIALLKKMHYTRAAALKCTYSMNAHTYAQTL